MNSQYRKNLKAILEANKNYTDKKIDELKWYLGGYDLSLNTNSDVAYQKSLPIGAISCNIDQIGGMSYKSENKIYLEENISNLSQRYSLDKQGETYIFESTGSYSRIGYYIDNLIVGKTYTISYKAKKTVNIGESQIRFSNQLEDFNYNYSYLSINSVSASFVDYSYTFTATSDVFVLNIYISPSNSYGDIIEIKEVMLNEGSSSLPYQPYFEGIRDTATTSVVFSGIGQTDITKQIPSQIQAITGYGWGVNSSCYNYIDFDRKVFVQKVSRVDLGSLNWSYNSTRELFTCEEAFNYKLINNVASICSSYDFKGSAIDGNDAEAKLSSNMSYCFYVNEGNPIHYIYFKNASYTDAIAFKTAMSGVYLYYELATPVETAMSEYIVDFNPVDLNNNYTDVEFVNTYNQDMPNTITCLVEEVKA